MVKRREAIGVAAGLMAATVLPVRDAYAAPAGRIKQSVSRWPYNRIPLAEFARAVKEIGLVAVDLLQPEEWPVVHDAGLV